MVFPVVFTSGAGFQNVRVGCFRRTRIRVRSARVLVPKMHRDVVVGCGGLRDRRGRLMDVAFMHILYGEDRIGTCPERREDDVFGWTPCFTSEWNTYVNTYEITLAAEFIILSSFAYYVIYKTCEMVRVSGYAQVIIYVLNTLNLVFAIILLFSSPKFLDGFKDVFTVTGFVCSLALAGVLEIVSRMETRVLL